MAFQTTATSQTKADTVALPAFWTLWIECNVYRKNSSRASGVVYGGYFCFASSQDA